MKNLFFILTFLMGGTTSAQDGAGVYIDYAHQEVVENPFGGYNHFLYGTIHDPNGEIRDQWGTHSRLYVYDQNWNGISNGTWLPQGGDTLNVGWSMYNVVPGETYNIVVIFTQYGPNGFSEDPIWGVIDTSTVVPIDFPTVTGLSEKEKPEFSIYPNPAVDFINIAGIDVDEQIWIFDQAGRLLVSLPVGTKSIEVSSFPSGVYLIRTKTGKTLRFLKTG